MSGTDNNQLVYWPELKRNIEEKRCELVLSDRPLDERTPSINDEELQNIMFSEESPLNFVDLTQTHLSVIYPSISNVKHLTNLVLRSNSLKMLPTEIGLLGKLKLLDLSFNELEELPETFNKLGCLATLNLSNNKLTELPDFSRLVSLQLLDVSHNSLTDFPSKLPTEVSKLQTLVLKSNRITSVPDDIGNIADQLKSLDISENALKELPLPIAFLSKLKILNLTSNKFSDKRFGKLAADTRHSAPSMIDYLKKKAPSPTKSKGSKAVNESSISEEKGAPKGPCLTVNFGSNKVTVTRLEPVVEIRPYIACCLLRNIEMDLEKLKLILAIQNKLHDTLCSQRTLASIGTHDCEKIALPLSFTALEPDDLNIKPLNRKSCMSGRELVASLTAEAEQLRKKQKRNTYTSVHKYLYLVEKLARYPCIVDANNTVLSFAPVTNSETTKLGLDTHEIFVEVTSNESHAICLNIMDRFIEEIATNKFSANLVVEQIKVFQHTGDLLIAYPGKKDLQLPSVFVKREMVKEGEEILTSDAPATN